MTDHWNELSTQIDHEIAQVERRLDRLRQARSAIASLSKGKRQPAAPATPTPRRRGKGKATLKAAKKTRPRKTPVGHKLTRKLPTTGSAFWLGLLGNEQRTGRDIVDAAMAQLGLDDNARDAIYSRAANWFNGAVKKSLVVVAGQRDGVNVYQRAG